tara:strand:+ start:1501 stop:1638 length:138 start_codon:yes stop_codon:yes gene_type:complete
LWTAAYVDNHPTKQYQLAFGQEQLLQKDDMKKALLNSDKALIVTS